MLEEVVADASIPVDAEADAEDAADFRRFLDGISPAELVRHIRQAQTDGSESEEDSGDDDASSGDTTPS
jgi:hypothetical protein